MKTFFNYIKRKFLEKSLKNGKSIAEISKKLNCTRKAIYQELKKGGEKYIAGEVQRKISNKNKEIAKYEKYENEKKENFNIKFDSNKKRIFEYSEIIYVLKNKDEVIDYYHYKKYELQEKIKAYENELNEKLNNDFIYSVSIPGKNLEDVGRSGLFVDLGNILIKMSALYRNEILSLKEELHKVEKEEQYMYRLISVLNSLNKNQIEILKKAPKEKESASKEVRSLINYIQMVYYSKIDTYTLQEFR